MRIIGRPLAVALVFVVTSARAATFTVTNTNDSGPGSLRQAIDDANGTAATDTIHITATGTIQLASALPGLSTPMTIEGPGAAQLTVRRNVAARFTVFRTSAAVKIVGVTISNGLQLQSIGGGGIAAEAGSLELEDVVVSDNSSDMAGAIYTSVATTIRRSRLSGNSGRAALYASSQGAITLLDTIIADNPAAAIIFPPANGKLTLTRCLVARNTTKGVGGVQLQGGTAVIEDSTFSGNTGTVAGDFWTYSDGVSFELRNVTSNGSSSPAFRWDHKASASVRNTIFAGTGARCALGSNSFTQGHNLSTDDTCNLTQASDLPNTNPLLGALADNGGLTQTHALLMGSPAIDTGDNTNLSTTDQRGLPRIGNETVDIGAFEVQPSEPDAGTDAGEDAGPIVPDASTEHDADAAEDAGSVVPDARTAFDAGDAGGPADESGCNCATASSDAPLASGLPAAAAVVFLAARLRRRRRAM